MLAWAVLAYAGLLLLLGGETEAAAAGPAGTAGRGLFPNGGAAAPLDDGVPLILDELLGVEVVARGTDEHGINSELRKCLLKCLYQGFRECILLKFMVLKQVCNKFIHYSQNTKTFPLWVLYSVVI